MLTCRSCGCATPAGVEVLHACAEAIGNMLVGHHGAHGEAVAYGLAQCDHVGHHVLSLKGPEVRADAAKATLHLQQHAIQVLPVWLII